ncbi:MAG: SCP2 sterol-binding domain-containing protein [Solirubrobacteraceae bacterium]
MVRERADVGHAAGAWRRVLELWDKAAEDEAARRLLGRVGRTVRLSSSDLQDASIVIRLQGDIELIEDRAEPADIELTMGTADLERHADGTLRVAMAIAAGRATFTGPVREFLRVIPIVHAIANPPVAVGTNTDFDVQDGEF